MAGFDLDTVHDALFAHFYSYWTANAPAVNGGVLPEIEWPNDDNLGAPLNKGNVPWARVSVKHTSRDQAAFGGGGSGGSRLYRSYGSITVQIFAPSGKQGLAVATGLGKVALDAFEGKHDGTGELWFRNVVPREVGQDGTWYQLNVTAGFTYDVVK